MAFANKLRKAWNAFRNKDPTDYYDIGPSYVFRPDRTRFSHGNERSIITSIYNRIAMDTSSVKIQHIKTDENGRFLEVVSSGLNECLTIEANVDQTGRAFIHDLVMSMLDEGCVAAVPIETDDEPDEGHKFKIYTMRTGRILNWYPRYVKMEVYNEEKGRRDELMMLKDTVAIIENPMYAVMNEPNSTMKRLIRKLNLMDAVDEQLHSSKLNLIIQLPYVVRNDVKRAQAEARRNDMEKQLAEGKYGIAYVDGTERITQLNRPVENNLMKQIEYLIEMVYSQLGITKSILDGSADDKTMLNYYNRVIEPILSAIVDEMKRKFLTKTAITQGQTIAFFRDPFKVVPVNLIAEIADTLTRNEIMTSNEFRQILGLKPSKDPNADVLRNKNVRAPNNAPQPETFQENKSEQEE